MEIKLNPVQKAAYYSAALAVAQDIFEMSGEENPSMVPSLRRYDEIINTLHSSDDEANKTIALFAVLGMHLGCGCIDEDNKAIEEGKPFDADYVRLKAEAMTEARAYVKTLKEIRDLDAAYKAPSAEKKTND